MPVPKRQVSRARRDKRQSCKFIRPKPFTLCGQCAAPVNSHQLCRSCGFYKGRKVLLTKHDRVLKRAEEMAAKQAATQQAAGSGEAASAE